MNWTKWSAVAEVISSLAIVITLIFLTVGVRQNTDAMQSAAREGATEREVEWLYVQLANPELATFMYQEAQMEEHEARRLVSYLVAFMRLKEVSYRQYTKGVLDDETWGNYLSSIVNGPLATPNGLAWWLGDAH